ncbi:aspartate-semialdehyde dehydrogenase [Candidatus Vidania fulgoroideorum]
MKLKVAIYGYRGIVGRTMLERIKKRNYRKFDFFILKKRNFKYYKNMDIVISCKDNVSSKKLYKEIKNKNWKGYFLDTSSYLRNKNTILLDPINKSQIIEDIKKGKKTFSGGNCTVSLMLISIIGILNKGLNSIYCTTYQSISGAGYNYLDKFLNKNREIFKNIKNNSNFLKRSYIKQFKGSNCFSLEPWIDLDCKNGNSKEEEKGLKETKRILNKNINVYSTCVRTNSIRCHSISVILKFNKDFSLRRFKKHLSNNKYIRIIKNDKAKTCKFLNPIYCAQKYLINVGRIRKFCKKEFSIFIVGDQLIWGAVEPIIRTLFIIKNVN